MVLRNNYCELSASLEGNVTKSLVKVTDLHDRDSDSYKLQQQHYVVLLILFVFHMVSKPNNRLPSR